FQFILPVTWDENEIHIIGLLIDPAGRIDNAGKTTIAEAVANGYQSGGNAGLFEATENQVDETVKVAPNPVDNQTFIYFNIKNETSVELSVEDLSGKIIASKQFNLGQGTWSQAISMDNLSCGVYLVKVKMDGKNKTIKVLKK
ncbi:MAG: T9SS type A sorting domain-containing protein, partial [Bacteroidetes bacterium]|nr:T9SS type A sorting domain-containing protein [Bacteroidota bacterium]